jgi:hypothetical protein
VSWAYGLTSDVMNSHSLFSFENVHRAYLNCRRGKRTARCTLLFKHRLEESLLQMCKEDLQPHQRRLRPVSNGCDFLGYIVKRTHRLPCRGTVQNCREQLRQLMKVLVMSSASCEIYRYPEAETSPLFATLTS